ncbi:MAG: ABC transporter ATP-binding protein [Ardenticatenaceae bacterium]|nr:ABC transporter ATP-binding protein [Ardenticatenaceae bacterium]MCB8986469.1 ABC transporter ATP-binding protein [Ardenticatenaceae bacterium]
MIEISNVTKRYYTLTALNSVSFQVPQGEVLGLLGPNGAGKTTLFKLIAGILTPTAGKIRPSGDIWPKIGYKPERLLFPNHLRVNEYLQQVAHLSNIPASQSKRVVQESLERVNLQNAANKKIKECSKGMRQRLAMAQILIGDPPLLLLDEPSNGLDPTGQAEIHECIQALHETGKTIIMSTHHLQEVTEVCTHLVILNHGQVHYDNNMEKAMAAQSHIRIRVNRPLEEFGHSLAALHDGVEVAGDVVYLKGEAMEMRRQVLVMLLESDFDVLRVEHKRISLSEIYAEAVQ